MVQAPVLRVFVNRCWRNRGQFSPWNYFVMGRSQDGFGINIAPVAMLDKFVPDIERHFAAENVIKWAEGHLNPIRMTCHFHQYMDEIELREILRSAFLRSSRDLRLDQFHKAKIYDEDRSLGFTIADLLEPDHRLH